MAALVIVLSFVGAPIAAVGASDGDGLDDGDGMGDSLGDDGSDTNSSDSDGGDSDDGSDTNDDSSSETNDNSSSDTDDGDADTNDSDTSDDGETDEDGADSSDESNEFDDAETEETSSEGAEEVVDAADGVIDTADMVVGTTGDAAERSASESGSVVDDTAETIEGAADSTAETVAGSLGLLLAQRDGVDATEDASTTNADRVSAEPKRDAASIQQAAAENSDDTAAFAAIGGSGQPVPAGPAGAGVGAIGLGALAVVAMLKNTPILAGVGAGAGSSALSGGQGLLESLFEKVRPFLFPLRYSRYDDSDPLEHQARKRVFEVIKGTPGSYLSEVSEQAELPLSTTRHHIKVLEREDLVSGAKLRGKRRFYPAYAKGIELAAAMNDESTASIIDAIARLGTASVSDLADDLGRDPSTISHHLQRLEEDDIIARERDGRAVVNKLSPEARSALDPETTASPAPAEEPLAEAD
jgi:DNA-binding MarR family transcriptional regulator